MNRALVIKMKGEDGYKMFTVRLKGEIVARIEKIASQTGRSRNELIGILLEYALDNCVIEEREKEAEEEKPHSGVNK